MVFTYDPKESQQPKAIPEGYVQVAPDIDPSLIRPVTMVAGWCNNHGMNIISMIPELVLNYRRYVWTKNELAKTHESYLEILEAVTDYVDPDREAAQKLLGAYKGVVVNHCYKITQQEHYASSTWQLLSPGERMEHGCSATWECDPETPDLYGQAWNLKGFDAIRNDFVLKDIMGYQWNVWYESMHFDGIQEYVRRGWLEGPANLAKAQATADRRAAVVELARERRKAGKW